MPPETVRRQTWVWTLLSGPFLAWTLLASAGIQVAHGQWTLPAEDAPHEGTWLQWPHNFTYGSGAEDVQASWVAMAGALAGGERVHVVVYNAQEAGEVLAALNAANVDVGQVDVFVCPTDDFWVRDNGPVFVTDADGTLAMVDWGFNGWGGDAPFELDDAVPEVLSAQTGIPRLDLSGVVLEGGAVEVDGQGTLMATRSSVTGPDRNPGLTEAQIEDSLATYLGVSHVIWLDGQNGGAEDITDQHIDAFARFAPGNTLVTMDDTDLAYWQVSPSDREILATLTNAQGLPCTRVELPLTQFPVQTTWGQSVGYRSSYVNYYVANEVVLVPWYNDPMDEVAQGLLQEVFPNRTMVGIDCRNMVLWGGMVHCVTQQQPEASGVAPVQERSPGPGAALVGVHPLPPGTMFNLAGQRVDHAHPGQVVLVVREHGRVERTVQRD